MNRPLLTLSVLLMGWCVSFNALALACYSEDAGGSFGGNKGGVTNFLIDPSASVPEGAPNNTIVWRAPSTTVKVICYKDARNYPSLRDFSEQVYFWPGKTGDTTTTQIPGIKIGFRYDGTDIYNSKQAVNGFTIRACKSNESDSQCEKNTKKEKTITYQPLIVTRNGTFTSYNAPANIFQVDGSQGYNGRFANYRSRISNMNILKPTKCEVSLSLDTSDIDFGILTIDDVIAGKSMPMRIKVTNEKFGPDCPAVKLSGYFENIREGSNNDYIPVYDETNHKLPALGIKIYDGGTEIGLNEPILPGFEIEDVGYANYQAKLYAIDAANIPEGKFNAMVVYMVSYL
ncbi:fimbrial protein [Shewanella sp. VB17]|uniref:fimbrial protein n=1 Tax=Shewanella sp. VB17 TaxID=2739432 RepID=UPI001564F615|nr:fimbrial protein [Shewanella sp. VB17]NRD74170.1 fimbrial protein [Shewanella sp. VB17]